jgi:hypothetical protein
MRVALDIFARSGIETHLGQDLVAGVRAALRHYTRRLAHEAEQLPGFPRFRHELVADPLLRGTQLELNIDPAIEAALAHEAREFPGVTVEQMVAHAVMVYLADLDRRDEAGQGPSAMRLPTHSPLSL